MKVRAWLAVDAGYFFLLALHVSPALVAATRLHTLLAAPLPAWLAPALVPLDALVFLAAMAVIARLVRLALPRLRPGSYAHLRDPMARAWMAHFALQRILGLPLWGPLYYSFSFLRVLALRALGARVPWHIHTSSDAAILDASLLDIGRGTMFGGGSLVCGHFFEEERIILAPVKLGVEVQLLGGAVVSPGVTIGDQTVVGAGSRLLLRVTLGAGVHIGMGSVLYNDVRVGDNAVIGNQVTIEAGAKIGAGAVIASGVRIAKGAEVADGARVTA
jgi:acetyltransferase-like isoleucine patch superfamily enzyme